MRIRIGIATLALFTIGLVVLAAPAHAATFTVTTTSDVVNGGDGLLSLREAFAQASSTAGADVIDLSPAASYSLTICAPGALVHTGADALTLQGHGATITQTCQDTPILRSDVAAPTFTVDSVTLIGGPNSGMAVNGAGILSESRLVLSNSTVTGADGGAGGNIIDGGSGSGMTYDITITNSVITGNDNTAINIDSGSVSVNGSSQITSNNGNGIGLIDGSPLSVVDSLISGNSGIGASTTGMGTTQLTITNSTITDNGKGGVSCSACGATTITEATITGNGTTATFEGGGVSFTVDQDDPTDSPQLTITDSTIADNNAARRGGGVFVGFVESSEPTAPAAQAVITGSQITGNTTTGSDRDGGGIAVDTGDLTVTDSTVADNDAGTGGAMVVSDGGGIYAQERVGDGVTEPYDVTVTGSTITGNSATGSAGGLRAATEGVVAVTGSTIGANTSSAGRGGGAEIRAHAASLTNSRVTANGAQAGAGVSFSGLSVPGTLTVTGSTIDANNAASLTGSGGGLLLNAPGGTNAVLQNSTITGNQANRGGGIATGLDESVLLEFVTLTSNTGVNGANAAAGFGDFVTSRSVIAEPLGGGGNCNSVIGLGAFDTLGYSWASDATCNLGATDTVSAADPQLGALGANGGPTPTRLPATMSPLGGLVPAASCTVATDQRGITRPQGTNCEPGAVEIAEPPPGSPIEGTGNADLLLGTPGNDVINARQGPDLVFGFGGNDTIDAGPGNDTVDAGAGNDTVLGGPGRDVLIGGAGNDVLRGGPDVDVLVGGRGNDTYDGGPGPDVCFLPNRLLPRDC